MQVCGSTTENYRNEIFQHFHYFARPRRKSREQVKQFKSNVKFSNMAAGTRRDTSAIITNNK